MFDLVNPVVHVHTQVDDYTIPYVQYMWQTAQLLAQQPKHLKLTIHCMAQAAAEILSNWVHVQQYKNVEILSVANSGGSTGHGNCIMQALAQTGDKAIHVISDGDAIVLVKGWDNYLRKRFVKDENRIHICGTTYEDIGEFSSGHGLLQTYKKIPTFTWGALSPFHDWQDLNFMPNKNHTVNVNTHLLSHIYNVPVGYSIFGEAGWQLPQYLYDNQLKYEGWHQKKPSKDALVLKGLTDYHEEYHVVQEGESIPFVVHHRGSLRHKYREGEMSKLFYDRVDNYVALEINKPTRWVI